MAVVLAIILIAASCAPAFSSGNADGEAEPWTGDPPNVVEPDPPPTTTAAPTTTLPPVPADGEAACAKLDAAETGDTIVITGGVMADWETLGDNKATGCDIRAHVSLATDVTVRGDWKGDVRCRNCTGWVFEDVTVTSGSLRMIGGARWTIRDSSFDGGQRGFFAVVGTGSVDEDVYPESYPRDWLIDNIESGNGGCRPAGFANPTHVRALYVIGWNDVDMDGVVQNSTFRGWDCAYTVKIGGTGSTGACPGDDAADAVTFRNNTIVNEPAPAGTPNAGKQPDGLLVATNSDDVTVDGNTITAPRYGVVASGPFTGERLVVTDNDVTSNSPWLLWKKVEPSCAQPYPTHDFVNYTEDPCPGLGTCSGNTLREY